MGTIGEERHNEELRRLVEEQTALRRIATLVAEGANELDLIAAVTSEIGILFDSQTANTLRWEDGTFWVIGDWNADPTLEAYTGRFYSSGGDTVTARVAEAGAPTRVDSLDDLKSDFARQQWRELGVQAAIGAPIIVDGELWGIIATARTTPDDAFPEGAEQRLGDFATLVAQAIANLDARREMAALADEQAALRRVATLVAAGRPQTEILEAVTREAGYVYGAQSVDLVKSEGVPNEAVVVAGWSDRPEPELPIGAYYHAEPQSATMRALDVGLPGRAEETSPELGSKFVIAAPVIVNARLLGALTARRPQGEAFPVGAEIRLRSFADLAAQSIANEQAHEEMRASRARIMRAADDAREKLERNLHDGAQQRLVARLHLAATGAREARGGARRRAARCCRQPRTS